MKNGSEKIAGKTVIALRSLNQDKETSRTPKGKTPDLDLVVINGKAGTRGLATETGLVEPILAGLVSYTGISSYDFRNVRFVTQTICSGLLSFFVLGLKLICISLETSVLH